MSDIKRVPGNNYKLGKNEVVVGVDGNEILVQRKSYRKNESDEEKALRLKKHENYMFYILKQNFRRRMSDVFKEEYFECLHCDQTFYSRPDAQSHYFDKHKEAKNETKK